MKKSFTIIIIAFILILAFFLRVWKLDTTPVAISNDEVVRAYNAYSIWETHGYTVDKRFLPLSTSSDGQDLSPVSFYLSAPITGIFGLNLFTARIGYALVGVLSVFGMYLLGSQLFNKKIGLLSSFVLAVSPWHILVSRGLWDAGVSMCLYIYALFVFVKYVGTRKMLFSIPLWVLGLYAYHGTVIFLLLIMLGLVVIYHKQLVKNIKMSLLFACLTTVFILPIIYFITSGSLNRESVLFWKSEITSSEAQKRVREERERSSGPVILKAFFNNTATYYLKEVTYNYLNAFSADHLFIRGDITRITGYGNYLWGAMHLIELPFLLAGVYFIFRSKYRKSAYIVLVGLLAAPVTSAIILMDRTYLFRSIMMVPFLSLLVGYGIWVLLTILQKKYSTIFSIALPVIILAYLFFIAKYTYSYMYQYGIFGGEHLFKSSRDVAEYVTQNKEQYSQVYVKSPEYYFLLQYAFFNNIDPSVMQSIWNEKSKRIGNVTFVDWCISPDEFGNPDEKHGILYIAPHDCVYSFTPLTTLNDVEVPIRALWNVYER